MSGVLGQDPNAHHAVSTAISICWASPAAVTAVPSAAAQDAATHHRCRHHASRACRSVFLRRWGQALTPQLFPGGGVHHLTRPPAFRTFVGRVNAGSGARRLHPHGPVTCQEQITEVVGTVRPADWDSAASSSAAAGGSTSCRSISQSMTCCTGYAPASPGQPSSKQPRKRASLTAGPVRAPPTRSARACRRPSAT